MNVDPLSSLSEEEMRQLLLKRKADKEAMGTAYSGVDESVGIPKGRFNPGQYAPTYGAAPPPGLSADHYGRVQTSSVGHLDRSKGIGVTPFKIFEGEKGEFKPGDIFTSSLGGKLATMTGDRYLAGLEDLSSAGAGRNIPKAYPTLEPGVPLPSIPERVTPMVGYGSQELSRQASENILRLQADQTSPESQQIAAQAYEDQADALARKGMTPGQRQDVKAKQFETMFDIYRTRVVPNLERARAAEDKANLPILKQALEPNQTLPQFINTISQDWRVLANLVISSVAKTPEAIVGGTIGAVVGTMVGNPVLGAAVGIGGGASVSEVMIGFNDALAAVALEANFDLDMQTEEGLRALLARPDLLGKAEAMNQKRAGVVGSGMFLSTLFAGKIATAMYKAGFRSSAITAAIVVQGVGEGGTEAGAQVLSGEMAAKGGLDYGSIFSETVASLATAGIPITAAIVKARGERKQLLFNLMQDDINNEVPLPPELQDHFNDLQKRLIDKFPNITWDEDFKTGISPKTGKPIINQGRYDQEDKKIHLSLKAIITESDSAKDALNRAESLATRHERLHQVAAWYRARGDIEDDPIKDFLKTNNIAINEWINTSPAYEDLIDRWNNGDESAQLAVAEEYLAAMSESDTGLKGKVKLWALRVAKKRGWDIDTSQDARLIVQAVLDRFKDAPWAPFDSAQAQTQADIDSRAAFEEAKAEKQAALDEGADIVTEIEDAVVQTTASADTTPKMGDREKLAATEVPQKWRELETSELQALMQANRAEGKLIWRAQFKELQNRKTEVDTEIDMFANIARRDMTPQQVITRNVNNFVTKRGAAAKDANPDLLKRLQMLFGAPAVKARGGEQIGTTEDFIRLAKKIAAGNTSEVKKFVAEGEELLAASVAEQRAAKPTAWAKRKAEEQGVSVEEVEIAPRETVPKFEKFMSPKLAADLNRQRLESGEITQAEFDTAETKIAEAQTTIRNTNELQRYLARNVLKGFDPTPDQLVEIQRQAEFVQKPSTKADIKPETTKKEIDFTKALDDYVKSGGVVEKIAPVAKIIQETGTSNARRIMGIPIEAVADPNVTEFGEVKIEGELYEGFSVDDDISPKASVVRKPSGYKFLPEGKIVIGNVAFTDSNQKVVVLRELENGMYEVQWNRAQSVGDPDAKKSSVTIRVHKSNLRGTTSKDASENMLAWNKQHKEMFPGKTIGQLTDIELKKLIGAHTADGVGLPDSVKRRIYTRLWGKKNSNDIAKFINSANDILGKKFMSADHTIEIDQMITPGVLKSLLDGTASEELLSKVGEVLDQSNLTFMPQFLNDLKKHLRHFPDDAKANALNEWYNTLNEFLDEGKKTDEGYFIDSHLKALQSWISDEKNLAVFPKTSAAYKSIQELKDLLTGPNADDLFAEFGGTKEDKAILEASLGKLIDVYQSNLKSKGMLSTNDENLINAFSTTVKSGLEFNASVVRKKGKEAVDMPKVEAHFTSSTLYNFLSFAVGRITFAVDAFNRESFLGGSNKGDIPAAAIIANLVYRNPAASGRPEGMETGTDMIQELSLRTGEFQSKLSKIFSQLTNNEGVINPEINAQIIDHLAGKDVAFESKAVEAAAKELQTFMDDIYKYAKSRTGHLKVPLDLRGAGDTVLPRVWNTQYIATKKGKEVFLRTVADKFTDPEGKSIFDEIDITPEDLYTMVVNSGGFVQGDWRQNKQDQTTSTKEIEKGELIQEYLDSLTTEELVESGLVIDDLQAILPRFINKAVQRTEYSAIFGSKDEILRALIQAGVDQIKAHNAKVLGMGDDSGGKIIDEKQFKNKVFDMSNILRGKYGYESVDLSTRRGLQMLSNVETIAKLPFVMFASIPELGAIVSKGSSNPAYFAMELGMATAWAGYKAVNGVSKLLFNKHLPAMLKHSSQIGGLGIIRDIQLLREMGIADIHAMGDVASTRYVNPSFAPGGIKSGAKSGIGGRIPKGVRAVFNMQTFMQATMLTTLTEMQQFMALKNFQRHMGFRMDAVNKSKGKKLKGKRAINRLKQYKQDMLDYGLTEDMDLSTIEGEAAFKAATLRFVDQVITRPNDATTAKIFRNPLTAPLVLFKRFITTYGNTLLTSIGRNMADKVDNVERSKQVGKLLIAGMTIYGGVMFAEMMRAAIKGDLEDEDFDVLPKDYKTFMHRVDRMGVLGAPGSLIANLTFPSKAWYGDTGTNRMVRELTGPLGSDMAGTLDYLMSNKKDLRRLLGQISPITRQILPRTKKKKEKKRTTGMLY